MLIKRKEEEIPVKNNKNDYKIIFLKRNNTSKNKFQFVIMLKTLKRHVQWAEEARKTLQKVSFHVMSLTRKRRLL